MTIDGVTETASRSYDGNGRPLAITYPSGFEIENVYTATGYR